MIFRFSALFAAVLLAAHPALAWAENNHRDDPRLGKRAFKLELQSRSLNNLHGANGAINANLAASKSRSKKTGSGKFSARLASVDKLFLGVNVSLGKPVERMPLYISMDSPLLSVAAKGINGASKAKYDPTKSETAHQVGKSEVSSSTHITSVNYQEMVSVAGVEVLNQTVQVMTSAPRGKTLEEVYQSDVPWAGTFGLGRSDSGSSNSTPSYLENLIRMNAIDRHVCGISITNEGGFLDFGFLDRRAYTGDVLWVEVDSEYMENYWTIQMDGVGLNSALIPNTGGRIQFSPEHRFSFISKSLGERWFANISHDVDPTLNVYTLPCELKNTDTIGFAVNGRIFSVPILTLVLSASPLNSSMCLTAIRRVDDSQFLDDKLIVMGAIQMRSYYTILSYEKEHQGLALGLAQASGVRLGGNPN